MSTISVWHDGVVKHLALTRGIPVLELNSILQAAYGLDRNILAVEEPHSSTIYPISLLALDPSILSQHATYHLLLAPSGSHPFKSSNAPGDDVKKFYYADNYDEEFDEKSNPVDLPPGIGGGAYHDDSDSDDDTDTHILDYIQNQTGFANIELSDILKVFRKAANQRGGEIDLETFETCFAQILPPDRSDRAVHLIAKRIFDVFDRDNNGYVSYIEFMAGLSMLCRGSSEEKIRSAFSLFDTDGDGYVSFQEMLHYMTSFFEVCFALDANMKKSFGTITTRQVAEATAKHCFQRADLNQDGRISFAEFKHWYNNDNTSAFVPHSI